jgi:ankyrin repeat protein
MDTGQRGVVAALLAAGARAELTSEAGNSALLLACREGRDAIAMLLLRAGAPPARADREGVTPLEWAERKGLRDVAAAIAAAMHARGGARPPGDGGGGGGIGGGRAGAGVH